MWSEGKRDEGLRHLQRGQSMERANRLSEAVEHYRQAIVSCPHLREAHNALGFYYQRNGLLAKAADEFRIVANLEGDFLAYFNLGYVLVELERPDEALEAFEQCLRLDPHDVAAHFEVALLCLARHDYSRAQQHLELPLRSYDEDWEVHSLLGKCLLGLRSYDEAVAAFGRALLLAPLPTLQAELIDSIITVERHREFRSSVISFKDQLYAQDGVVYLGSASDDGLQVSATHDFHFTYPDIATTLQRLRALAKSAGWTFSAVVAADAMAQPLALVLAQLLELPLRSAADLVATDRALLIFAVAREAELLLLAVERLPCPLTAFVLGLNWMRHSKVLPDLVGIAAYGNCSVPWEAELRRLRAEGAGANLIAEYAAQAAQTLLRAVQETPLDPNLPRQIRYYTRLHRRVNIVAR